MTDSSQRVDLTGRVLMNKLRVERLLGEGGMGAVYEVEHLITRHHRAIKVMHAKLATSPETIARFIREAGVAGTLRTPYVVETFDAGQLDDGSPYVLMELLEGRPMSAVFESAQPVTVGRLVGLICQVLEGLAVAHRAGIVHRDIKPDNVFVGSDERGLERVRILDFGISKFTQGQPDYQGTLTTEGAMMGTPYYMSPEQALGLKDIDARSDLYSVGVMLYEGLARKRPYEGQTLAALVLKIHHGDHVRLSDAVPTLPKALADAVERAMAVEPARRFASAEEMLAALVPHSDSQFVTSLQTLRNVAPQFAETLDAPVASPVAVTPAKAPAARRPAMIAAAVAAGVLGLGLAAWGLAGGESASPTTSPVVTPASPPDTAETPTTGAEPPTTSAAATTVATSNDGSPTVVGVADPVPSGMLPPPGVAPPPDPTAPPPTEDSTDQEPRTPRPRTPRGQATEGGSAAPTMSTAPATQAGAGGSEPGSGAQETGAQGTMATTMGATMGTERYEIDRGWDDE